MTFFYKNWKDGIGGDKFLTFFETEQFSDMQSRVKEINGTLDKVQVKKALEQIMALGQVANTYFSDQAPWAQIKEDDEAAQLTIAHSAIYAITLACLFTPYLPTLSGQIKEYFGGIDEYLTRDIYTGEFKLLKQYVDKGVSIQKKPKGLVQKIDADRVKALIEELNSMS